MEFFATCPTGFEQLLAQELRDLGMEAVRPLQGQVSFGATPEQAMEACLWSRLASRIVLVLGRIDASTSDELYESLSGITWEEHLLPTKTFAIDASGTNAELRTTQFVALRAKDAIVDRLQETIGTKPIVDAKHPDLRVVVRISRNRATVGIDFAGEPLFRRGYERDRRGFRPDYAAAMLAMGGWAEAGPGALLLDAHSEQGTMLVEAASIAAHQAPGLLRARWGFEGWAGFDPLAWQGCLERAHRVFVEAPDVRLATFDGKPTTLNRALRTAGIAAEVQAVCQADVTELGSPALLTCDLIGPSEEPAAQASLISRLVHAASEGKPRRTVVLSKDSLPQLALNVAAEQSVTTRLGRDEAQLNAFGPLPDTPRTQIELDGAEPITPLVAASDQFAARLKKVARLRARWAKREDVTCYRVYDADLPDYALTIDYFQGCDPHTIVLAAIFAVDAVSENCHVL